MSVRRTRAGGEAALIAQVSPTLWKIVYPSGKVTFAVAEAEASDSEWDESKHPRGDRGRFAHGAGELSAEERDSVLKYAGRYYAQLNRNLRQGLPLSEVHDGVRRGLDSLLQRSTLHTDTTLYRGIGDPEKVPAFAFPLETTFGQLKEGDVVENLGFVSTTYESRTAYLFSKSTSGLMEISAPAGTHAFDVGALSEAEPEILLPRGTKLRYTGRGESPGEAYRNLPRTYKFEVVPTSVGDWNPLQPRVPAGQHGGGEWTGGASQEPLSGAERSAIYEYSLTSSALNAGLRNNWFGEHDVKFNNMTIELDSAINKSPLGEDKILYRGVNNAEFAKVVDSLKPGDVLEDKGFLSTSDRLEIAEMHRRVSLGGDSSRVMEIRASAGQKSLNVSEISSIRESEYLLPRDSKLRYVGKAGGRHQFDLVGSSAADWNPFQPRVPKGSTGGGEWTESGATGGLSFAGSKSVGLQAVHTDALKQYTANIYYPVNKALRAKPMEQLTDAESRVVSALDEAFERAMKTTEVMQLFRAAGEEFASVVDTIKVGDDVVDPAFVSTTTDENYARTLLSGQPGEKKALIEVVLPKDSRAIDTSPYNPFKGENETLLPRDTTFRYLGKERDVYRFRANPRPIAA